VFKPFRPLSDRVSRFSGIYDLSKEYDLNSGSEVTLSFFDLASEIMHSYVFELELNDKNQLTSFYVNSYRGRDERLLRVQLKDYVAGVEAVVSNEVQEVHIWKDRASGRVHAVLK
jgi:hypothetical protein